MKEEIRDFILVMMWLLSIATFITIMVLAANNVVSISFGF